jgi:hypothetical protein
VTSAVRPFKPRFINPSDRADHIGGGEQQDAKIEWNDRRLNLYAVRQHRARTKVQVWGETRFRSTCLPSSAMRGR